VWLSFPTATVPKNTWLSAIFTTFKVTRGHSYSTLIDNHCIYSCLAPFRFMAYCLLHVLRPRWTPRLFGECFRWISPTSLATKTEIPRILCCVVCAATCLADRTLACVRQTDGRTHADTCYMPRCVLIHAGPTVRICCAVKYALHGGCDLTVCSRLFWSTLSSTLHCWHSEHRYYGIIPLGCSTVVWTLLNWATLRGIVPMAVIRHATVGDHTSVLSGG